MTEELKKITSPFLNELACSGDVIDTLNSSGVVVVVVVDSRQHLSSQQPYSQFFTDIHLWIRRVVVVTGIVVVGATVVVVAGRVVEVVISQQHT